MPIGMSSAFDEPPAIKSSSLPQTQRAITSNLRVFEEIFNTTECPFSYSTHLDFIVGETLGMELRKLCKEFYYSNGKQLEKILDKPELRKVDRFLSQVISKICRTQGISKSQIIPLLREATGTADEY
ncbi:hypothetical protein RDSD_002988 [Oleidesulfovibrio alaskensis]